jgi:hypothetical protein
MTLLHNFWEHNPVQSLGRLSTPISKKKKNLKSLNSKLYHNTNSRGGWNVEPASENRVRHRAELSVNKVGKVTKAKRREGETNQLPKAGPW